MPPDASLSAPEGSVAWAEELRARALKTVEVYQRQDALALQKANRFQQRLYRACRDPKPDTLTVVLALKPNRVGGSWGLVSIWRAIIWGTEHKLFQGSPFGDNYPFLKSARLFSTAENLADVGALQVAVKSIFPSGKYEQSRGVGKGYNSAGTASNGWTWDAFSYGQDALAAAGANKGLILMSEPPPRPLFTEGITRLSGNGILIIECVQLDLATWLEEMAEEAGGKTVDGVQYGHFHLDGKIVGEIRVVRGDVEDCCREHSDGHMAHSAIESMVAAWPEEEREARRTGKSMKLSGRIYPTWGDHNELDAFPDYHQDCLNRGEVRVAQVLDPHDRKPWAMTWWACFPNEDIICISEWPPFKFSDCKSSPVVNIERYRDVIIETDTALDRPVDPALRIIDGMFGAAIKSGRRGMNVIQMLAAPCLGCEEKHGEQAALAKCLHRLNYNRAPAYDGSVRDGHILVRNWIGEAGARPKVYALKDYCPNFCMGMRRYAYKENLREDSGLSEAPQLVHKDFPDNLRMLMQCGGHVWPAPVESTKMIPKRGH